MADELAKKISELDNLPNGDMEGFYTIGSKDNAQGNPVSYKMNLVVLKNAIAAAAAAVANANAAVSAAQAAQAAFLDAIVQQTGQNTAKVMSQKAVTDALAAMSDTITTLTGRIGDIRDLIPSAASASNQLADKAFVNSSIATSTAEFRGTYNSLAELQAVSADENDYGFVRTTDAAGNTVYKRYKYSGGSWTFEYDLNNSSFTAAQWAAINSAITAELVAKLSALPDNATLTAALAAKQDVIDDLSSIRSKANSAYQKPSGGIPASDIADGVIPDIADNLTTNDATKALSAKQGKVLNENLTQLGQEVDEIDDATPKIKGIIEEGFYVCDTDGNVLLRLDILDTKVGIGPSLKRTILEAIGEYEVLQSGFYITDETGGVIAKYANGDWVFYGEKRNGFYRKTGDLAIGDTWVLSRNSVKNNKRLVFSGTISSFDSITIGHGATNQWNASWAVIDGTNLTVYNWNRSQTSQIYAHGLTITNNIQVEIVKGVGANATVKIASDGVFFSQEVTWYGANDAIYVNASSAITNCSFSWTCDKLKDGVWLFGDSFLSVSDSSRWPYYLIQDGFLDWMQNGHSGGKADDNLLALYNLLKIAKPRAILWLCNGNHSDPFAGTTPDPETDVTVNKEWLSAFLVVENICKQNGIELVLETFPTSSATQATEGHDGNISYQEPKNAFVRQSGYRYIDFNAAVGGNGTGSWWPGMKNENDVHPTVKGAKSLYQRAICDAPELMQ